MSNESKAPDLALDMPNDFEVDIGHVWSGSEVSAELRRQNAEIESLRAQLAARVPEAVVASALFDFGGYLTTLEKSVSFGSYENASPMVEHLQEWARIRGLSLDKADVIGWPDMLSAAPSQQAPHCATCNDNGLIGGPSYYAPDEGGAPCPDCSQQAPHPDDAAVDRFAVAMKDKLAKAREKGRGGWQECDAGVLSGMLRHHVEKGDPRDVANFCMFLWSLGHGIAQQAPVAQGEPVLFVSEGQLAAHTDAHPDHGAAGNYIPARKTPAGKFTTALYTSPQQASEPMTREQIKAGEANWTGDHFDLSGPFYAGARFAERHHQIKGKQ